MDHNWLMLELLSQQAMRERRLASPRRLPAPDRSRAGRSAIKRALAASLVRLGLRLDPAAGEGLGAFGLPLAQPEARRRA